MMEPANFEKYETEKNFTQLYLDGIDYIIQLADKSPTALKIYMLMLKFAEEGNVVEMDIRSIMDMLHMKRKAAVIEALEILREDGYVATYRHGGNNFYLINPNISINCDEHYKQKIIAAYRNKIRKTDQNELVKLAVETVVDTSAYYKKDRTELKRSFYKKHKELQKPTEEEILQMDKDNEWLDDGLDIEELKPDNDDIPDEFEYPHLKNYTF